VDQLKRVGESLMAKHRQVQPEFSEMVKSGLYKKRSASFYPDGSLRHIGFLGAQPRGHPTLTIVTSCWRLSSLRIFAI
jgi:hypothetical protein